MHTRTHPLTTTHVTWHAASHACTLLHSSSHTRLLEPFPDTACESGGMCLLIHSMAAHVLNYAGNACEIFHHPPRPSRHMHFALVSPTRDFEGTLSLPFFLPPSLPNVLSFLGRNGASSQRDGYAILNSVKWRNSYLHIIFNRTLPSSRDS